MIYTGIIPLGKRGPGGGEIVWTMCMLSVRRGYLFVGGLGIFYDGGFYHGGGGGGGGGGGEGTNVMWLLSRGEPEGDNPPLVDVA